MLGQPCPIPVIEAKKALKEAQAGATVEVLVDNDIARQNLQKMAAGLGYDFKHETQGDHILIKITSPQTPEACPLAVGSGLVVAIGSDEMGQGSSELGRTLMKSFIYSLTELSPGPEHLLFYNSGVKLAAEGSTALDDLAVLAQKGVSISCCGACLNYYNLTDNLKVGAITNMYALAEIMASAPKLINM